MVDTSNQHLMQCMEVWGGNTPTDSGVVMAGLDAWVYSKPYQDASGGGDVYYVSSCATGRITRLLVADVAGHGASVAQTATNLRRLMRRYVNHLDSRAFVRSMNEEFGAMAKLEAFATAVVTTFFAPTNSVSICNAGHPPPLHYRAKTRRWSYLQPVEPDTDTEPTNVPLGIVDLTEYRNFDVDLDVNDLMLCYTDCLPESRDVEGELLGNEKLLEIVQSVSFDQPSDLIPKLLEKIGALHPQNLNSDDVTILLFRPNGLAPSTPLKDRLRAPLRIIRATAKSLFGKDEAALPDMNFPNIAGACVPWFNRLWTAARRSR